jgi:hypothetical protein
VLEKHLEEEILSGQFYFPCVLKRFPLFPILSYLSPVFFVSTETHLPLHFLLQTERLREMMRQRRERERERERERDSWWRRATRGSKVFILQGADRIRGLKLGGYGCWAIDVVSG